MKQRREYKDYLVKSMSRYKIHFIAVFIAGLFFGGTSVKGIGEQYADEFNVLVTSLRELHPTLYRNIGKDQFEKEVNSITERLLHTTDKQKAVYMIQELMYHIGSAHCGNLSVYSISADTSIKKVLPFNVYILHHELYIKNWESDTSFNGAKIITIENTSGSALIDSLKIFFPLDGHRDVVDYYLQPFFNALYAVYCGQKDSYWLKTSKGMLNVTAAKCGTPLFEKMVTKTNDAYFDKQRFLKEAITDDYGYFRFANFISSYKQYKVEDDFYEMIETLNSKKIKNLIIDLRYNEGGDPLMGANMLEKLANNPFKIFAHQYTAMTRKPTYIDYMAHPFYFKVRDLRTSKEDSLRERTRLDSYLKMHYPDKDGFKGHIYIITGSVTKSAGPTFCAPLIGQSNVTFVGDETSGAVNYFWAGGPSDSFVEMKFPAMKTIFAFGIELLEIQDGTSKTQMPIGLIPEHHFEYSISDLLQKRDKEMEWIVTEIKK